MLQEIVVVYLSSSTVLSNSGHTLNKQRPLILGQMASLLGFNAYLTDFAKDVGGMGLNVNISILHMSNKLNGLFPSNGLAGKLKEKGIASGTHFPFYGMF